MADKEIDLKKIYKFPKKISYVKYKDKNLVIYNGGCNWLVFSDEEYKVFKFLEQNKSIEETFDFFCEEEIINVITQIEAKKFENPLVYDKREFNICIYLTNKCNLRCEHCYMYSGDLKINELPAAVWKNLLNNFKKNDGKCVTFTGGELLLYRDWLEILKYAKESLGLTVAVLSNGLLWKDELIKQASKYIDQIQISVDGYDENSYFKVRKAFGFFKALDTSKKFSKLGTKVSLAVTPLYDGLDKFIIEFKKFIIDFKKDNTDIQIDLSLELIPGRNIVISPEKNKKYRQSLKKLVNDLYPEYYFENFAINYIETNRMSNCGFGSITIAPDGAVYWCNRITELKSEYNIKTTSIGELKQLSENVREKTSVDHVRPCSDCEIRYICGGGCRLKYKKISSTDLDRQKILFETNCSIDEKNNFYKKMVGSNEYFYIE